MSVYRKTKLKELSEERQTIVIMVLEGDLPSEVITEEELEFVEDILWEILRKNLEDTGQYTLH